MNSFLHNMREGDTDFMPQQDEAFGSGVFYVHSDTDQTVLIGFDIKIQNGWIRWLDSVKERMMRIQNIRDQNPAHFVFERSSDEGGGVYVFEPLTLEFYNKHIKARLLSGKDFSDEKEMKESFISAFSQQW